MEKEKVEAAQAIPCPYYPDECDLEFHPLNYTFCTSTGKPLLLRTAKVGKNIIIISVSAIALIILAIFLAERFGLIKIRIGEKEKTENIKRPELPEEIFKAGGKIVLGLQSNTNGFGLMPDIVEAYLEKHGVSNIEKIKNSQEFIVKGVLPEHDPIVAEIHSLDRKSVV